MTLKGLDTLNKTVSTQFAPFGLSARLSDDFSYLWETEEITFKVNSTLEDDIFEDFVKDCFGFFGHPFLISLLHEVGHHFTLDSISQSCYDYCAEQKERINAEMLSADTLEKAKALEYQYFNLPVEYLATEWAVRYCKENAETAYKIEEEILKALNNFYKENNITED